MYTCLEAVDEHLNQFLWVSVVDGFQQKGTHATTSAAGNGMNQHKALLGCQAPWTPQIPTVDAEDIPAVTIQCAPITIVRSK